jgi:histone H1/5
MADTAAPAVPVVKKATKPKVPAAHPPYAAMIAAAIKGLGDKKGSSRQAILKSVVANNKVDAAKAAVRVRLALKKLIADKKVVAAAAAGKKGAGSYKLAVVEKKAKKVVKKPKAKKVVKKKPAKKAAKKPAAKKAAKKPAAKKPAAKKPAAKKPAAKKPAAKKPAAKKAAKPAKK